MSPRSTLRQREQEAFRLESAEIKGPQGVLLSFPELLLKKQSITVIFGPAGTGKSLLLRALSGTTLPTGWTTTGRWSHQGVPLDRELQEHIAWLPQRKRDEPTRRVDQGAASYQRWQDVLDSKSPTILLDEPDRGLEGAELQDLIVALRLHTQRGAGVVVTHNQLFAQAVADQVILLCEGEVAGAGTTEHFFESPPTPLAAQFIRTGNCSPPPPTAVLPPHFHWILPGQLAGMGKPGLLGDIESDLTAIALAGVHHLVTLTKETFPTETLRAYGLSGRHFPITDMSVPATGSTARLCASISRQIKDGQGVALHCHAGLGRTGTILACVLVWDGMSPEEAVRTIRKVGKGYIQNEAQLAFVSRFAETV